jgi:hypothetical protein
MIPKLRPMQKHAVEEQDTIRLGLLEGRVDAPIRPEVEVGPA